MSHPLAPTSGATPKAGLARRLADLSRYFDILYFKTYANLRRDVDKTHLGSLWWVIEPLLTTLVYYVIVSHVLKSRGPGLMTSIFVGNIIYGHFSTSIGQGTSAILGNAGLIQQLQLPKSLYPMIAIANVSWKFLFSLVVILPLLWLLHAPLTFCYLALPLLLVFQLFVVISLSLPIAILLPYFQDGKTLITAFLGILMWLSGVFYTPDRVPHEWRPLFFLNPAASLIESYRDVLVAGRWPHWEHLIAPGLLCLASGLLGFWLIAKLGKKIAKLPL